MEKKGNSGCRIAALIVGGIVLVFALVVGGLFWMLSARNAEAFEHAKQVQLRQEEAMQTMSVSSSGGAGPGRLQFDESDWRELVPLKEDEAVSLKQFILTIDDPRATELARETFRERADGAPVTWSMTLASVKEEGGLLVADLDAPYAISKTTGSSGTTTYGELSVQAEFDSSQRDALIKLRRGDSVTVQGRLALDGRRVRIVEAVVAELE
jgi:hypothetical protein